MDHIESRYFNTPLIQGSFKVAYDPGVLAFLRTLAFALTRFARRGARTSHLFSCLKTDFVADLAKHCSVAKNCSVDQQQPTFFAKTCAATHENVGCC